MDGLYITRNFFIRIICLLCVFTVLCTLTLYFILQYKHMGHERRIEELENSYVMSAAVRPRNSQPLYVVGIFSADMSTDSGSFDSIAVYDASSGRVVRLLSVNCTALPESDIFFLTDGIPIYTDDELCSVIADYTG